MFDPTQPPATLPELIQRSFAAFTARPYLGQKDKGTGQYQYLTYGQVAMRVRHLAAGFIHAGLERGQRVAILSENRIEWALIDLACQMCGLIVVPMFSTLPSGQVGTILMDCAASAICVSNAGQLEKVAVLRDQLPSLLHVWNLDGGDLAQLEANGETYLRDQVGLYESTWPAALPEDVATIIYTSGTTGEPKGVMLTHRNLIFNVEAVKNIAPHLGQEEVFLSFLPLAHVYERTAGHFFPLRLGASIGYCESLFTVDKNLVDVSPTVMTCVPRLYESTREKLYSTARTLPVDKKGKYLDALALAEKAGRAHGMVPGAPGLTLIEKLKFRLYDGPVYSKIRAKFGGRLKHFVSGGAPMSAELGSLFLGLGLEILEGYGLTETSPVIAVNRPGQPRLGTVGAPLPGVEVRIAPDGEIMVRSASVMKGYWGKSEATSQVIDAAGWFHTGDIGVLENDILRITDRKKDLLVLANGKKVAPQPIEISLQESRYISQAVLLGDSAKGVVALIIPNFPALKEWAASQNLEAATDEELVALPQVQKMVKQEVDERCQNLADFEKIRRFAVLAHEFTAQSGELTPTLKVKRAVVSEKYGHLLR